MYLLYKPRSPRMQPSVNSPWHSASPSTIGVLSVFFFGILILLSDFSYSVAAQYDKCDSATLPQSLKTAFSLQPDDKKVYKRVQRLYDSGLEAAGVTKFASAFGVRVLAQRDVGDTAVLHTVNMLAQLLDHKQSGTPSNPQLVKELQQRYAAMVIVKSEENIDGVFNSLPEEYECFIFLIPEVEKNIQKNGLPEPDCKNGVTVDSTYPVDKTIGFVAYFLINGGYPTNFPQNSVRGKALEDAYKKSLKNKWFQYNEPDCDDHCMKMLYQSWALTSALGFDACSCREAGVFKLCTPEEMLNADPELYGVLTQGVDPPDGYYFSDAVAL